MKIVGAMLLLFIALVVAALGCVTFGENEVAKWLLCAALVDIFMLMAGMIVFIFFVSPPG